ncbi:MAG: hypothetical protein NWF04_07680 [Candidatus Bathyarchaeota archaeon]|nr:hypothetical protein [Candidatus Bathyarchaeota archaeon]
MREIQQLFYEKILFLKEHSTGFNFLTCARVSTDLITTAAMFNYQDGVFIAEVFEGVFFQLQKMTDIFDIEENDQKKLKDTFESNLTTVAESFKKSDRNELYQALSNLRYETTKQQYKCAHTQNMKEKNFNPFEIEQ